MVGPAAADISRERIVDLTVRWIVVRGKQDGGRHDLPGLTISALGNLLLKPGPLHRMTSIGRESLDGGYALTGSAGQQYLTRARGIAVEDHGACAALSNSTSVLRAGHFQVIAQYPEQRHVRRHVDTRRLAIHFE